MVKIEARFLVPFLVVFLSVVWLVPIAVAIGVPPSQETITLTMERGSSLSFFLLVNEVYEEVVLDAEGEVSDWISFGEGEEAEIIIPQSFQTNIVMVTISVPDDVELDEYDAITRVDGRKLQTLRIKVTLELSDAKAYSKLSDVDEEVGQLEEKVEGMSGSLNNMRVQIATLEEQVSEKMQEIYEYQRDVTALEDEKVRLETENEDLGQDLEELQSKSQELEASNTQLNEMTGMLVGTQLPGMFFGGVIIGVIIVTLVVKRSHVARKVKARVQRIRKRGQDQNKYQWKPG